MATKSIRMTPRYVPRSGCGNIPHGYVTTQPTPKDL
jgi:hypothetical protein